MKMKNKRRTNGIFVTVAAATSLALTAASPGATLITGTSIHASSTVGANAAMGPENAINGSGLPGGVPSLTGSHGSGSTLNWWSGWTNPAWQITVDLGGNYPLEQVHVWNYREGAGLNDSRGLRNVEIYVSPDGDAANLVKLTTNGTGAHDNGSGGFIFPVAPTDAEYLGFDLDMSGVTNVALLGGARLFRVDGGSDTWTGGTGWGGLAEIQFGTSIPEPSVALLGGLGVLALLRRRRNA